MDKYIDTIINEIINEAKKAYKSDEVPVGAIIVKNGKIIAKGHNKRQKSHICTDHAEIIAIKRAEKKLRDWRLFDCELYVTLEPCKMCMEVIKQTRIKKVHFLLESTFNSNPKHNILCERLISREITEYEALLSDFFSNKRIEK